MANPVKRRSSKAFSRVKQYFSFNLNCDDRFRHYLEQKRNETEIYRVDLYPPPLHREFRSTYPSGNSTVNQCILIPMRWNISIFEEGSMEQNKEEDGENGSIFPLPVCTSSWEFLRSSSRGRRISGIEAPTWREREEAWNRRRVELLTIIEVSGLPLPPSFSSTSPYHLARD